MRIVVDTDRCIGTGMCEALASDVFGVGDDGLVHVLVADVPEDRRATMESAVADCPTSSLRIEG